MSDTILRIIPSDPTVVPSGDAQQSATSHLRAAFPRAEEVSVRIEDEVVFVDAGENFEAVFCPECRNELDQDWWAGALGRAAERSFSDLGVELPCCGASSSLNDLRYEMPQGFARFVIEVVNPEADEGPESLAVKLRDALRCELRFVWARY